MAVLKTEEIEKFIADTYRRNSFVQLCSIEIESVKYGRAVLSLEIDDDKHTNLYGAAHGGVIATLADTAFGVIGASVGCRVVTLNLSMNYINSIYFFDKAVARANVIHQGKSTMVVEVVIVNTKEEIIAKAIGTIFIVGQFEEIPEKW